MQTSFVVSLALALIPAAMADTSLGCFSSVSAAGSPVQNMYQTASLCAQTTCPKYAYVGLLNGDTCVCLNSFPDESDSATGCSTKCTGFGDETCGGIRVYQVYQGIGNIGAGTQGSSSSGVSSAVSSTSSSTSSSSSSSTSSQTSTSSAPSSDTTSASSTLATSTVTSSKPSSVSSSSSTSSSTNGDHNSSNSDKKKSSTNVGAIAGGVVGGIAAIAIIAVAIFFFVRYRNSDEDEDDEGFNYDTKPSGGVSRGPSKIKSNVLDMPMTNPFTHPSDAIAGRPISSVVGSGGARAPGVMDPRLNPVMMGRRRLSEGSLADEADYSRKILHVSNPDNDD